jgi:hypothetical protein
MIVPIELDASSLRVWRVDSPAAPGLCGSVTD